MTNCTRSVLGMSMVLATWSLLASQAAAAGGIATGTLMHFNYQGNYCPTSRNCSGAKYPQGEFNTARPIRHVKVYVRDASGTVIGQGNTNTSGSFSVSWYSPTLPSSIHLTWHAEHKDGRFVIRSASGATWYFWTYPVTPVDGGTTNLGTLQWGSSGSPHDITNIYDGAHRMWWDSLWWSSRQTSYFTGIQVYAVSTVCSTSCADADTNEVWLDPNAAYAPQARVMHELGHIASERAHLDQDYWAMAQYCWPSASGTCGWSYNTPEWRNTALEEATASFFATLALYWGSNPQPHDCYAASAACGTGTFDLEAGSGTSCGTNEDRWPLTYQRILWDMYDTHPDSSGGYQDSISGTINDMHESFALFPNGRGSGQKNEGWVCDSIEDPDYCNPSYPDARGILDYRLHYQQRTTHYWYDTYEVLWINCN